MTKVIEFFKKYWMLFLGALAPIVYWLLRRDSKTQTSDAASIRSSGQTLSSDVEAARAAEAARLKAEAERHAAELAAIKQKYEQARDQLNDAEKAEADRIVKEHGSDPVALAEELSKVTGFRIVMPKD